MLRSLDEKARAIVLFDRHAVHTQPLIATIGAHVGASSTYWAPTGSIRLAGFPWAPVLRPGRAVGAPVPA
eukprot:2927114-Pyramimonas_sp.AAC.1